jgi:Amt family ammonium transporter
MLKPRYKKFNKDGSANVIPGHNMPLVAIGVFILWFGWYGFNAGSTLGFGDPKTVARIALNTTLSPATAAFAAMMVSWIKYGKPDLSLALNGVLGGLVGITASCAVVGSGSAILIGLISGALVVFSIEWLNKLKIDDVVGAFPVHGVCGIFGTLAVGIFGVEALGAPQNGLLFGGGFNQLWIQCLGVAACIGFTAVSIWIVFKVTDAVIGLRVSHETELKGLDVEEHGMESYSGFQIFTTE